MGIKIDNTCLASNTMHLLPLDHIKLIGCRGSEFAPAVNKIVARFIGLQQ